MAEDNFHELEKKWLEYWEKEKIYKFDPNSDKQIYSIDTPPPTVSGKMHIGVRKCPVQISLNSVQIL
ncbi:class I tRNA ligase family protein [Candidatus Pacearchaeota archaeon]|nr:class I tRNA ligase family protein [Candidatus Pacearchaeota archaeon]